MRDSVAILNRFKELLTPLTWTPSGGEPQPAFQRVELFGSSDLVEAFKELLLSQERIALVVYMGSDYETKKSSAEQTTTSRKLSVMVIVSDRVMGSAQKARFGSDVEPKNPGCLTLKDLIVEPLTGRILGNPDGVESSPINDDLIEVEDLKSKQPGRVGCVIEFEIKGGQIVKTTPPSTIR